MKYQHRVVGLLALLSVITYLDRVCIAVAGPRMQESLHISPERWGWVTGIFLLSYGAFEIPTGILGDRIGASMRSQSQFRPPARDAKRHRYRPGHHVTGCSAARAG